jgi:drug/metabolite transporter (DMT)-like permease
MHSTAKPLLPILLVSTTIVLNLASAVLLKEAASSRDPALVSVAIVLFLVLALNLLRVFVWSAIHRRYPLSNSYPLTSLFFPIIMLISIYYGESIGWTEICGAILITLGVATLSSQGIAEGGPKEDPGEAA